MIKYEEIEQEEYYFFSSSDIYTFNNVGWAKHPFITDKLVI